jgi:hypothetical protein
VLTYFGFPYLGAIVGGAINGGFVGAASALIGAGLFTGVGNIVGGWTGVWGAIGASFVHGLAGGFLSHMMGGSFRDGFIGAFVSRAGASAVDNFFGEAGTGDGGDVVARTVASAVVGGTASKVGGGRFYNGALSAAFGRLFNEEQDHGMSAREKYLLHKEIVEEADNMRRFLNSMANDDEAFVDFFAEGNEQLRRRLLVDRTYLRAIRYKLDLDLRTIAIKGASGVVGNGGEVVTDQLVETAITKTAAGRMLGFFGKLKTLFVVEGYEALGDVVGVNTDTPFVSGDTRLLFVGCSVNPAPGCTAFLQTRILEDAKGAK